MNNNQMNSAKQSMSEWLSHPNELGKAPAKIECAGEFELNGLRYYIFKFKKTLLGKWLLGVCGGYEGDSLEHCGHVFSEMEEYSADTAEEKAAALVEYVRSYWKNEAEQAEQSEQENDKTGGFVGFTLLSDEKWDKEQFISDLKTEWDIDAVEDGEKSDDTLIFDVGDMFAAVSLFQAPIPNGEAEENAESNYLWQGAVEAAKSHKAHIVVAVMGKDTDLMERGKLFVKLISCCCRQKNAVGVYTNGTVFEPKLYIAFSEMMKKEESPLFNLVWFGLYRSENGVCDYTNGLSAFGKDEIEILNADCQPSDLRDFLTNIAAYVLESDVTLQDGETIGLTADDKHSITRSEGVSMPGMTLKIKY